MQNSTLGGPQIRINPPPWPLSNRYNRYYRHNQYQMTRDFREFKELTKDTKPRDWHKCGPEVVPLPSPFLLTVLGLCTMIIVRRLIK
jgi:hypothetical protein